MFTMSTQKPEKLPVNTSTRRDWTVLYCNTLDEADAAIKDRLFIHSHIIRGIRRMVSRRMTSDMCLEIWVTDAMASIWVAIRLSEAEDSLQRILDYRVECEAYEECVEVSDLLNAVRRLKAEIGDEDEDRGVENGPRPRQH